MKVSKLLIPLALLGTFCLLPNAMAASAVEYGLCNALAASTCDSSPEIAGVCAQGGLIQGETDNVLSNICKHAAGGVYVSLSTTDATGTSACSVCIGATNVNAYNAYRSICTKKLKGQNETNNADPNNPLIQTPIAGDAVCIYDLN